MNYCDQCGQRVPKCYICKQQIPVKRARRDAITCSKECFKVWRKDKRKEREAVKRLREDLASIRAGQEARNTVPDAARATLGDEFKQAIDILKAVPDESASGVEALPATPTE